ncbi:MAG: phosphoadenosine phosphosulfate reductase family protein [Halanaerobiales bacterium]|nr:phosphoadenosine phosphosulfate reductase family protein [Halanaerobiales bacterium]
MNIYWCKDCKVPIIGSVNISQSTEKNSSKLYDLFNKNYSDIDDLIIEKTLEKNSDSENVFLDYKLKKSNFDDWIDNFKLKINNWFNNNKSNNKYPSKLERGFEKILYQTNDKYNAFTSNLEDKYKIIIPYQKESFTELIEYLISKFKHLLKNCELSNGEISKYINKYSPILDQFVADKNKMLDLTCPSCNADLIYMAPDIRPVFMEERILLSEIFQVNFAKENIWKDHKSRYYIDGEKANFNLSDIYEVEITDRKIKQIKKRIEDNTKKVDFTKFIDYNDKHINRLINYSSDIIKKTTKVFSDRYQIISFSGGKDSTVVSDLVRKSLQDNHLLHIFGDTTLEFPTTYDYINKLREKDLPPFLVPDTSKHDFFKLVDRMGPPSRIISWCCSIFKTGPIGKLFHDISKENKILTYYGIRRNESIGRSQYSKISQSPKIEKQMVFSPIIDWKEVDIWLYLLKENVEYNKAYEYGYSRVGCWMCPNNSKWSEFLTKIFFPDKSKMWNDKLVKFAKNIGKPDPKTYVRNGKWKARHGGRGLSNYSSIQEGEPCTSDDNVITYNLSKKITPELYELFKPFGTLDYTIGNQLLNEIFILDSDNNDPIFSLQGNEGSNQLRIKIIRDDNTRLLIQRIECQLRKYQNCIYCSACRNVCPNDAISLVNGYKIDENKCDHCMKCVAHFHKGCLIVKALEDYQ